MDLDSEFAFEFLKAAVCSRNSEFHNRDVRRAADAYCSRRKLRTATWAKAELLAQGYRQVSD
jgi:hypothetical protein